MWEKYTLWEETTRVPLIISDPRRRAAWGGRYHQPVEVLDVVPTVVDLLGLEHIPVLCPRSRLCFNYDGKSLLPAVTNPDSGKVDGIDFALSQVCFCFLSIIITPSFSLSSSFYLLSQLCLHLSSPVFLLARSVTQPPSNYLLSTPQSSQVRRCPYPPRIHALTDNPEDRVSSLPIYLPNGPNPKPNPNPNPNTFPHYHS
jgi:hypothetical protein